MNSRCVIDSMSFGVVRVSSVSMVYRVSSVSMVFRVAINVTLCDPFFTHKVIPSSHL